MSVGALAPAGKLWLSSSWPVDGLHVGAVAVVRSQVGGEEGEAQAHNSSTATEPSVTRTRWAYTTSPTRFQNPWVASDDTLAPAPAQLVGLEDRAVERTDDQRRDRPAGQLAQQRVEEHERQEQRDQQGRADHGKQRA